MLRIDKDGALWVHTSVLRKFKNGEVRELVFIDDETKRRERHAIHVEVKRDGKRLDFTPTSADDPQVKIIQYTTV